MADAGTPKNDLGGLDHQQLSLVHTDAPKASGQMSKRQQRRQRRREHFERTRDERIQRRKEKKELRRATKLSETPNPEVANAPSKPKLDSAEKTGDVAIHCAFHGLMNEKEQYSLCKQISHCYALNRRTSHPFNLTVCDVGLEMREAMGRSFPAFGKWTVQFDERSLCDLFASGNVVYLSADADNVLSEIRPDTVYVIGGLVDRNRHKNVCRDYAQKHGLRTARLPLDPKRLCSSVVLTVNHIFEILLRFRECSDWEVAIGAVVPTRKMKE